MAKKSDKEEKLLKEIERLKSQLEVFQNAVVEGSVEIEKRKASYDKLIDDTVNEVTRLINKIKELEDRLNE